MVFKKFKYLIVYILILKVLLSAAQSSIKQYLHVTGVGPHAHSAGLANLPTVGIARQTVPNTTPNTGLASLSAFALPALLSSLTSSTQASGLPTLKTQPAIAPSAPTSNTNTIATNTPNGGLDSSVLNNLAIALQLLIVSNILNSPMAESESNPIYEILETVKNIPIPVTPQQNINSYPAQSYKNEPSFQQLPNANFVGSSGFSEHTVIDPYTKPNSRNNYALMSPYEALGPNSPFSDPILSSPYGSVISSKKDFHSPYVMPEDLFNMSDVF